MKRDRSVHIFYACDESFLKYTIVSLTSLIRNASKDHKYTIHILHTDISAKAKQDFKYLNDRHFKVVFDDVTSYLLTLKDKLPVRDYYSKTTYFRLFIAEMYPRVKKAVYVDSDTVVLGNIYELYSTDLGDAYVAACREQVMMQDDIFGTYVERAIGIPRNSFFNAGILVINCRRFRREYVLDQFADLLKQYRFVVTQDEDYLNVICRAKVKYLSPVWNVQTFGTIPCKEENYRIVHYVMQGKPWHYSDNSLEKYFWEYAKETKFYEELVAERENYTDAQKEADALASERLHDIAIAEIDSPDNYLNSVVRKTLAPDRVRIQQKIRDYERTGRFDEDVEDDPPAPPLLPDKIDYMRSGPWAGIKVAMAKISARIFLTYQLKKKKMIVKEIRGAEHLHNLKSGAVLTCNHFNAMDSFAVQMAYDAGKIRSRRLYRIIREGNYTGFPGFFGFLMRNYDTLPLSSNSKTMRKFLRACNQLLQDGHLILIYPEQSMWWNYRKPKPLKPGGFSIAAQNNVPVVPIFITMEDSDVLGKDGFFVQEYTIHISEPIYPDPSLGYKENLRNYQEKNYNAWKEIYEKEYGIPLTYYTEEEYRDKIAF